MNKSWNKIDEEAKSTGVAEYKLRQFQHKHNHKPILYNTIVRTNQIPAKTVKTKQAKPKPKPKPKPNRRTQTQGLPRLPLFSLGG